jgi:hypothetical protein
MPANICAEKSLRPADGLRNALKICASAGRRLPALGELVLAFDHLGMPQKFQWVATQYFDDNGRATEDLGSTISENASGAITFGAESVFTESATAA